MFNYVIYYMSLIPRLLKVGNQSWKTDYCLRSVGGPSLLAFYRNILKY